MTVRNFNNITTVGSLSGPVASSATALGVQNFTNFPTVPFTITVDRNMATEEICLVTGVAGGTLTVTRGYDGSAAQAHSAGAAVEHTAGAIEYIEANGHVNATANVHGVAGALVGTDGAQTLFAKTLVSPVVQADATAGDAVVAWVPPTASTRNLFRGMNTAGADVITVDGSGNATAHNVHATGTGQVDGLLTAAGGLTLPAGKAVTANGGVVATSVTVTGNETVAGNQTTTGAISGGSVTTLGPLGMSQLASDAAGTAGLEMVYAKIDGGIYRRSGTGAVARVPVHFGSGTTFPVTGIGGDLFFHTGLGCTMRWNTVGWRQAEICTVADSTARTALSTTYPGAMYAGFRIRQTDTGNTLEWDGSRWVKVDGPPQALYSGGVTPVATNAPNGVTTRVVNMSVTSIDVAVNAMVTLIPNIQCSSNGALFADVKVNGTFVSQLNRYHSQGTSTPPLPFPVSVNVRLNAGTNTFELWLNVDPGSTNFTCLSANAHIWI